MVCETRIRKLLNTLKFTPLRIAVHYLIYTLLYSEVLQSLNFCIMCCDPVDRAARYSNAFNSVPLLR